MIKTEAGKIENKIKLSTGDDTYTRNLSSESELHRILIHLSGKHKYNKSGYEKVPYLFTLDVGKDKKRYQSLINNQGKVDLIIEELEESNNDEPKIKQITKEYASTFCGAGHSRTQKNLFVETHIIDKMNDILLCGMPKDLIYDRPSKWNAYYAMVTTDSTPVSYMPNIVVIDDFEKKITDTVDVVEVLKDDNKKSYKVVEPRTENINIMPFDGSGLVTPQCAARWAIELGCRTKKKNEKGVHPGYLPSCFQFRAIPGIKGELMVFDLKDFAKKRKVSKITDLGGREWDIFKDHIDVILTKSQFKFHKQFMTDGKFDYWLWRNEFNKQCHGYKRTFNVVSYAEYPGDLKEDTMLSYQPLQSIRFSNEEIEEISTKGLDLYDKVTSNPEEFLKYRRLIKDADNDEVEITIDRHTPPYYVALLKDKSLYNDTYVKSKIDADLKKLKNNLLSGKQIVRGNYQVFMPDVYGLAEYAFGLDPKGLLHKPFYVYSNWWNQKGIKEVDIIRNPAIGMEHRIGYIQNEDAIQYWYKYLTTGIVTSMYDTLALALNGADFDGDTVCTTDNKSLLSAVKREIEAGHGRLVFKDDKINKETACNGVSITDRAALMQVNALSFKNSIGTVIDKITNLWTLIDTDENRVRDFIKIGTIVGAETIDFAKTGKNAVLPREIINFLGGKGKGYWMRYLHKNEIIAKNEEKSLSVARNLKKPPVTINKLKKFQDYDCNMNRLCHYAEQQILNMDLEMSPSCAAEIFDHRTLLKSVPVINRKVYRKLVECHNKYQVLSAKYRQENLKSERHRKEARENFRWFYAETRTELMFIEQDIDKLLDMLIVIYYGDKHNGNKFLFLQRDILWNAFPWEMVKRCSKLELKKIDTGKLEERHRKNVAFVKKKQREMYNKNRVELHYFDRLFGDRSVIITKNDRSYINKIIDKYYKTSKVTRRENCYKLKRILTILIFLSRKCEGHGRKAIVVRDVNGKMIKDGNGKNIKEIVETRNSHWFKKYNNTPNQLTYLALEKLSGVNHKYMETTIKLLEEQKILQTKVYPDGSLGIKVLFQYYEGDVWISDHDYNKAGTKIRDYFRKACS